MLRGIQFISATFYCIINKFISWVHSEQDCIVSETCVGILLRSVVKRVIVTIVHKYLEVNLLTDTNTYLRKKPVQGKNWPLSVKTAIKCSIIHWAKHWPITSRSLLRNIKHLLNKSCGHFAVLPKTWHETVRVRGMRSVINCANIGHWFTCTLWTVFLVFDGIVKYGREYQ